MRSNEPIVDLSSLYTAYSGERENSADVHALLKQTHWFSMNVDLDPKTGDALPQPLSRFLASVASGKTDEVLRDRLWRITDHARDSIGRLLRGLNESPRREHALLPIHAVRELDANSFIKLSNRPGRNIREKLGSKPYLQAVRRYQSVDLPENRLFKEFAIRLAEGLQLRMDLLGESEDALLSTIRSWLRSEEAQAISRWENLAPNNALLSHRDYRRVWDSWRWLQTLDDDIDRDFSQIEEREETMRRWVEYGKVYIEGTERFADMPVLFDYDKFTIDPWISTLATQKAQPSIARSNKDEVTTEDPVCVDLAALRPHYSSHSVSPSSLQDVFLWQHWKNDKEAEDITLFGSDAAYLHPDATTISSADLFFPPDNEDAHLDRAARAFAIRLRTKFKNNTLIWLVPDVLNDFELAIVRRNLNARFPLAEPLPRSVAATFEQVNYSTITGTGFAVVVSDTIGGKNCVTKLVAKFDAELEKVIPETRGYFWERCPHQIIDDPSADSEEDRPLDIATVDNQGQWRNPTQEKQPQALSPKELKRNQLIGPFDLCINLRESPVVGGIRLHTLKQRSEEIPLWRDQIPELSIKVIKDGLYQRFYLVEGVTSIQPIRGHTVQIPVNESFMLPAGKPYFQFPLFEGENEDEVGFSARLDSPEFPLRKDTEYALDLKFEYGADEPYSLTFFPLDNSSLLPVRAIWQRTIEEIVTDAPSPGYPDPTSWEELRHSPKPDSDETRDMLEWILSTSQSLCNSRTVGEICSYWHEDRNGNHFTFAHCNDAKADVFIHEHAFIKGFDYVDYMEGDLLSFELVEHDGKRNGRMVAEPHYDAVRDTVTKIRKSAYVPFIHIWKDGRSISDQTCPREFATAMKGRISNLANLLERNDIDRRIKNEVLFLLSCLHKDTTDACVRWNTGQVDNEKIYNPKAVGFTLGDMSCKWQRIIFEGLVKKRNASALSVFAYAIWREIEFVNQFSLEQLQAILSELSKFLSNIGLGKSVKSKTHRWQRNYTERLELLLGLLRTRASKNPDIKMLLQPHQEVTKEIAQHVERISEVVAKSNVTLFSRVQIDVQKPAGDRTPDLLYALRLFLTGDVGANAIHITGISDDE
jgi:hypothetical protein